MFEVGEMDQGLSVDPVFGTEKVPSHRIRHSMARRGTPSPLSRCNFPYALHCSSATREAPPSIVRAGSGVKEP